MFLAAKEDSQKIDEIARAYGISRNHLMKVAQRLSIHGFISSQRGRGGGLKLAGDPRDINIGSVVRAMEKTDEFVECQLGSGNQCIVTPICELKHILGGAVEAFLTHLDQYTLADMMHQKAAFKQLFETP